MKDAIVSKCNSWLSFSDDLNWSRTPSEIEAISFKNMLCHQLLFVEHSIIPDSWWLTNPLLQQQFYETDLLGAINAGWLLIGIDSKFKESGLTGRFNHQMRLNEEDRLQRLVQNVEWNKVLNMIDESGHFVTYDLDIMGQFFSNFVRHISTSKETFKSFGLLKQWDRMYKFINKIPLNKRINTNDIYSEFDFDKNVQSLLMRMIRPIYLVNAPVNYGYNIAIVGGDPGSFYHSVEKLLNSLIKPSEQNLPASKKSIEKTFIELDIEDPVFHGIGFLSFDEIAQGRAMHFDSFRTTYIEYCENKVFVNDLQDAYKTYQSNLRDFFAKQNVKFDLFLSKGIKNIGKVFKAGGEIGGVITTGAAMLKGVDLGMAAFLGYGVSVVGWGSQKILNSFSEKVEREAKKEGGLQFCTQFKIWNKNCK